MLRRTFPNFQANLVLRTATTVKIWKLRQQLKEESLKRMEQNSSSSSSSAEATAPFFTSKTPNETVLSVTIPFRSEPAVANDYVSEVSGLRIGRLLEDLDSIACGSAWRLVETGTNKPPKSIVTATMERIDSLSRIPREHDIELTAKCVFVGGSSIEVLATINDLDAENKPEVLRSTFLLVAINEQGKPCQVNSLKTESEQEKLEFEKAAQDNAERKIQRQALKKSGGSRYLHAVEEFASSTDALGAMKEKMKDQELYLKQIELGSNNNNDCSSREPPRVPLRKTEIVSTHLTQPQDANTTFRNIFGGVLCQRAYESAFVCAWLHGRKPIFLNSDDVEFRRPVKLGSVLTFNSRVGYVHPPTGIMSVHVQAIVTDPRGVSATKLKKTTNVFDFLFAPTDADQDEIAASPRVPDILFENLDDWMMFVRSKKMFDDTMTLAKTRKMRISEFVKS